MMLEVSDDELISSYLDGELDEESRGQFENRLANDSAFANKFTEFSQNDLRLKTAFSKIDNTPVPSAILALLEDKKDEEAISQINSTRVKKFNYKSGLALAASIFVVVLVVSFANPFKTDLQGNLTSILSTEISGKTISLNANERVRLAMSFKDINGNLCREYISVSGEDAKHAVSCYMDHEWRQVISGSIKNPVDNQFQLASGELSAEVEIWLTNNIETDPISLKEEALLLNRLVEQQ